MLFGWAQVWRAVTRDAEAIRRLAIDPHSPPDLRCNAVVTNLDAFHEAFDVQRDRRAVHRRRSSACASGDALSATTGAVADVPGVPDTASSRTVGDISADASLSLLFNPSLGGGR